jgi:DNA-binding MarR family transcriptional regulator
VNLAPRRAEHAPRFYAPDHRRQLRDAGAFGNLSLSENVVLAALCDRANASGIAWPAIGTIAKQYNLGESTVHAAIKSLTARGLLRVVRHAGRVNTYRLTMPTHETSPAGGTPLEFRGDPSEIWTPPLQNLDPIMTSDHSNEHDQQHHAGAPAYEAAAPLASLHERPPAPTAPDNTLREGTEDGPITLLEPGLVERVRMLGLAPGKVNRYGAERVRWVLDRLEADRSRKVIGNPAGWVIQVLKDTEGQPLPVAPGALAKAATEAVRPPDGTRWARHREDGQVLEVEDINDSRVRCAGGFNAPAIPALRWSEWEWFAECPNAVSQEPPCQLEGTNVPEHRVGLARLGAWAAVRKRMPAEVDAKLQAAGVTADEWEAYQATRALAGKLDS